MQQGNLERFNCFVDGNRDAHIAWRHQLRLLPTTSPMSLDQGGYCYSHDASAGRTAS